MRFLLPLLVLTLLAGCREKPAEPEHGRPAIPFRIDGRLAFLRAQPGGALDTLRVIDIEVADTDSSRGRGLMQRDEIPADTGMLFVFPREEPQAFYMANTPHALDILFFSADSTLLNAVVNTTPYSTANVVSEGPAQFVVEVAAGVSQRLGLVPGDRITWSLGAEPSPADTLHVEPA